MYHLNSEEDKVIMKLSKLLRNVIPGMIVGLALVVGISLATPKPTEASKGEATFKGKCASCHGPDGKGQTAMGKMMKLKDLGSAEVQKKTDKELSDLISKGKSPMPAFGSQLKKEQIDELVAYIRELGKKEKK
jgi:mono/diheme cytochrome c family protein